jgi:hypothetical protein
MFKNHDLYYSVIIKKSIMNTYFKLQAFLMAIAVLVAGCKKEEYKLGEIKAPTNLTLSTTVVGTDVSNPTGDGSGKVSITASAQNAITYKIDFGDGVVQVVPSGTITYKYANPGTSDYTITVNAIGMAGVQSIISKKVKVFVAFTIPADIISGLTGGASKIWITDKEAPGHFGVGAGDSFEPNYYAAPPNTREACAYDDEIKFEKDANNNIFMTVDNKGQSFSIGASSSFYGFGGGDACFNIAAGGMKKLIFQDATTASTPANSTRIQFTVPGNGIINFGTGGVSYEILSVSETQIHLRNIGSDGNSWYQKLRVKP